MSSSLVISQNNAFPVTHVLRQVSAKAIERQAFSNFHYRLFHYNELSNTGMVSPHRLQQYRNAIVNRYADEIEIRTRSRGKDVAASYKFNDIGCKEVANVFSDPVLMLDTIIRVRHTFKTLLMQKDDRSSIVAGQFVVAMPIVLIAGLVMAANPIMAIGVWCVVGATLVSILAKNAWHHVKYNKKMQVIGSIWAKICCEYISERALGFVKDVSNPLKQ